MQVIFGFQELQEVIQTGVEEGYRFTNFEKWKSL
jgi:hypothetical protein